MVWLLNILSESVKCKLSVNFIEYSNPNIPIDISVLSGKSAGNHLSTFLSVLSACSECHVMIIECSLPPANIKISFSTLSNNLEKISFNIFACLWMPRSLVIVHLESFCLHFPFFCYLQMAERNNVLRSTGVYCVCTWSYLTDKLCFILVLRLAYVVWVQALCYLVRPVLHLR